MPKKPPEITEIPTGLRIRLEARALDFLEKIPEKHAGQIARKINALAADPKERPAYPLKGFSEYFRVKSGEYRFIYRIEGGEFLLVLIIGKRNDDEIYRDFVRLVRR